MKFQLFSDIHLELLQDEKMKPGCKEQLKIDYPAIRPEAPYLILAGDIGSCAKNNFRNFIDYCAKHWQKVFYVCGNHEFYRNGSMTFVKKELENFFRLYSNVYLLDNSFHTLEHSVCIYGFTGWTPSIFATRTQAKEYLNDYRYIHTKEGPWCPKKQNEISTADLNIFRQFLKECDCKHIIVVTHFPPVREATINSIYHGDFLNNY